MSRPHLLSAAALAALLLASLAPTASAGTAVRYVDDDGRVGRAGCDGTRVAPRKVQPAISASSPGDTVIVCPGTYVGEIFVSTPDRDGVTVRGATPGTAKLRPRPELSKAGLAVVFNADGVTIRDLVLQIPTASPCRRINTVLYAAESTGLVLSGLRIEPIGTDSIGPCGYGIGVLVDGTSDVTVLRSTIRDFRFAGVYAAESNGQRPDVTVKKSRILFLHDGEGRQEVLSTESLGLYGLRTDRTIFRGNVVRSAKTGGRTTPLLGTAITAYDVVGPVINGNTVTTTTWAIKVTAVTGDVSRNTVTVGRKAGDDPPYGMILGGGDGLTVVDNVIRGFAYGLYVDGGAKNHVITSNDARGNRILDCHDDTTGGFGTDGTSNFWTENLGMTDLPDGICAPG